MPLIPWRSGNLRPPETPTATSDWVASSGATQRAFSLVFEGINLVLTDVNDIDGITAAYYGTDWTNVKGGLEKPGTFERSIQPFDNDLTPDSQTLVAVDYSGELAQTFLRQQRSTDSTHHWTTQIADIGANNTSVSVKSTEGFSPAGHIYWGSTETSGTVGAGAANFHGLTRGKFALFGTSTDPNRFGRPHILGTGDANFPTGDKPIVSDWPRTHYNRGVCLYMHHFENGVWSLKDDSILVWAGRIKEWDPDGAGRLSFRCTSVHEMLQSTLMNNRFTGTLAPGMYIPSEMAGVVLFIDTITQASPAVTADVVTLTNGVFSTYAAFKTADEVAALFNQAANAATSAGATPNTTTVQLQKTAGKWRLQVTVPGTAATATVSAKIGLHEQIWKLLGFSGTSDGRYTDANGRRVEFRNVGARGAGPHAREAEDPPLYSYVPVNPGSVNNFGDASVLISVSDTRGTSVTQTTGITGTLGSSNMLLRVGDKVFGAQRISNTSYKLVALLDGSPGLAIKSNDEAFAAAWTETYEGDAPRVEQCWLESGDTATIFLQILLSTGTPGYNHATYDVYPAGTSIGLGIPAGMVDIDSFTEALSGTRYALWLPGATSFAKLFRSLCSTHSVALTWDWSQGKFNLVRVSLERQATDADVNLSHDNMAIPTDRSTVKYHADGILNRATLRYAHNFAGEPTKEITINNLVSQADYGQIKAAVVEALGVYKPGELDPVLSRLAVALGLLGSARGVVERTVDFPTALAICPGDTVTLTDNVLVDPETGTEGMTDRACLVLGVSLDMVSCVGRVRMVMLPELDPVRLARWAPSARVDDTATNGGLDSSGFVLTLKPNDYSHPSQGVDASFFQAGDRIRLVELGSSSPSTISGTGIEYIEGNTVGLFESIAASWNATKKWVLEWDTYSTQDDGVDNRGSFLSDDSTGKIAVNGDAYEWNADPSQVAASADFTRVYKKTALTGTVGDANSAHILHDAMHGLVNVSGWRAPLVNDQLCTDIAERVIVLPGNIRKLVYGPVKLPLYHGTDLFGRALKCVAYAKTTAGSYTLRFTLSSGLPSGTSETSYAFPDGGTTFAEVTMANTSFDYTGEITIQTPVRVAGSPPFAWLTVDMTTTTGTGTLGGVFVCEGAP